VRSVLKGLASTLRVKLDEDVVDKLCVLAEGATNPASRNPILFSHPLGFRIAHFGIWPSVTVLAFDDRRSANVNTDEYQPAAYADEHFRSFALLARAAIAAIGEGNARGLGQVSTRSAEINDEFLPRTLGSSLKELRRIASKTEALGVSVSHSGSVAGLLYATGSVDLANRIQTAAAELIGNGSAIITPPFHLGSTKEPS
jgi:uncharacterized protein involved in propanediol utilization